MTTTADSATTYDLVILGGGSGGYAAALRAAVAGMSVALVEKDKLGGTCLHRGCIPTKALLHAAEVADSAREGEQFGVRTTLEGVDMGGVNKYKDGVVDRLFKGLQGQIKSRGITVIEGEGRLTSPTTVAVDGTTYTGKNVIIASGSYSRSLPGLEIDGNRVIASEHALTLDRVPESAVDPRRRRDRRRVRERVDLVRHQGDDRRGAPPAGAGRGRRLQQDARAGIPQAQDRLQDRYAVRVGRDSSTTACGSPSPVAR